MNDWFREEDSNPYFLDQNQTSCQLDDPGKRVQRYRIFRFPECSDRFLCLMGSLIKKRRKRMRKKKHKKMLRRTRHQRRK